jgi:hypothetical protein
VEVEICELVALVAVLVRLHMMTYPFGRLLLEYIRPVAGGQVGLLCLDTEAAVVVGTVVDTGVEFGALVYIEAVAAVAAYIHQTELAPSH